MKDSQRRSELFLNLKSFSNKVGAMFCCLSLSNDHKKLDTQLELKMMEIKRHFSGSNNFRSIDSIILKFPQIREGLKEIRSVFEKFEEDTNGTIDHEELKKCLHKLQFHISNEEIDELFNYCDMNGYEGIQFNEFIVLLYLIYILKDYLTSSHTTLKMEMPQIDATFNTIIEVFLFLDKNGKGKLRKKDVVKALNEASPKEKSPSHVTTTRFNEMDWDRDGKISLREFIFAFVKWVGLDSDEDDDEKS